MDLKKGFLSGLPLLGDLAYSPIKTPREIELEKQLEDYKEQERERKRLQFMNQKPEDAMKHIQSGILTIESFWSIICLITHLFLEHLSPDKIIDALESADSKITTQQKELESFKKKVESLNQKLKDLESKIANNSAANIRPADTQNPAIKVARVLGSFCLKGLTDLKFVIIVSVKCVANFVNDKPVRGGICILTILMGLGILISMLIGLPQYFAVHGIDTLMKVLHLQS